MTGPPGKEVCPDQTKMRPRAGLGAPEPITEEVGTWTGCCWKDNLLATLSYVSQSAPLLTGNASMLLQVLCT